MTACPTCKAFYHAYHRCPSMWDILRDDRYSLLLDGGEFDTVYGTDEEDAVKTWAEEDDRNSADYTIISGAPAMVKIRQHGTNDPWQTWTVRGESSPTYYADRVDEEATQ